MAEPQRHAPRTRGRARVPASPKVATMRVLDPQALKDARELRDLSQRELARRCRRSQSAISQVESGAIKVIERVFALNLTRELELDLKRVFAYTNAAPMPDVATTARPTHKVSV